MIRRAPTSISLSKRDVEEHLENIDRRKRQDRENVRPRQGYRFASLEQDHELTDLLAEQLGKDSGNEITIYEYGNVKQHRALREEGPHFGSTKGIEETGPFEKGQISGLGRDIQKLGEPPIREPRTDSETDSTLDGNDPVTDHGGASPEPSQMPRNTFDYGGFVEVSTEQSSSFIPQDASTPRSNKTPQGQRLSYTHPLPRSPLFRDQGLSPPEHQSTSSLAPRVASYGTPGLFLSQPARRPRSYRPRTISYSFEESDRASTAYDQAQGSDNDSAESRLPSQAQKSHPEEVDADFLRGISSESNRPSPPPELTAASISRAFKAPPVTESDQRARSSSPQLPLPPPFSTVHRNVSSAASLPSAHGSAGRVRSATTTSDLRAPHASPAAGSAASSPEGSGTGSSSILRSLAGLPLRLLSVYRSRSPFQTRFEGPNSGRVSPLPPQHQSQDPEEAPSTSARRQFQIYDDSVPASSQPQTPQHLPEARHQSRFHPSYTAPARGRMDSPRASGSAVSRRHGTRSDSPTGLQTPGFRGLYGGRENGDDEVMFDRASQRLWALSSARRHDRSIMNSPERDVSFGDGQEDLR